MSLTLQEFNDNFNVTVVHFDNSTSNVAVHFKVRCTPNGRLSIHTSTVDTTQLTPGYTHADITSAAWDSIKSVVNTWAAFNLVENRLTELTVASTSNAINVSTFNTNFLVKIIRFELVPSINPTNWCIGFTVCAIGNESTCNNYEGLIPLTETYCNNTLCSNIVEAGWEIVKDNVCEWAASKVPTQDVLDTNFVPTNF
jgi:hypothetical protein